VRYTAPPMPQIGVLLVAMLSWFLGNFLYSLLWHALRERFHIEESSVTGATLRYGVPLIPPVLIILFGGYIFGLWGRSALPQAAAWSSQMIEAERDPDGFYQLGEKVAAVTGATPDLAHSKISFLKILEESTADPSRDFEYRDLILRCVDRGKELPFPGPPPGMMVGTVMPTLIVGWTCDIVSERPK
jgi:hypothetical protein